MPESEGKAANPKLLSLSRILLSYNLLLCKTYLKHQLCMSRAAFRGHCGDGEYLSLHPHSLLITHLNCSCHQDSLETLKK